MSPIDDNRPVSELFADALSQFSKLMRNELELANKILAVVVRNQKCSG